MSSREVRALGDLGFLFEDDFWKTLKLNRIDRPVAWVMRKFQFLLFDVLDDGRSYRLERQAGAS